MYLCAKSHQNIKELVLGCVPPSPLITFLDIKFEPTENSIKSASYNNNPGLTAKKTTLVS